jgi:two-component system cell cycle response regulator
MRILIADDSPIDRTVLQRLLTRAGHEVVVAEDGLESWKILRSPDAPSLAILDWQMPGMDGLEVCRSLRGIQDKPYVFVILLTSNDQREQLIEGLEAGADDYLTKPVDATLLRARVGVAARILNLQAGLLAAQEKLTFQADHDSLTGLYNRAAILGHLDREISRAQRNRTPLGVVVADLDHFKRVNDTYGHPTGDSTLREVARRFTSNIRMYDMVGRLGGEEFLVLFPGCDESNTGAQAERLRHSICDTPLELQGLRLPMTVSLGGASLADAEVGSDVIARADKALYQAKGAGRNRVEVSL